MVASSFMGRPKAGPPTCHPDRPYAARGMCSECYHRVRYAENREEINAAKRKDPSDYAENFRKPPKKDALPATCHPGRRREGRGLCKSCYQKQARSGEIIKDPATCHPEKNALAHGLCAPCYAREKYSEDPEKYQAYARDMQKRNRALLREEMIGAYGGRCACAKCPETNSAFLTLDHVGGGGKEHRQRVGSHTYADLRRQGWPEDGYRLLCWNCNAMIRFGDPCPHELAET